MDAEYLDPAVFGDRGNAETFDAAMSRLSHHMAAKDAEIARLRAELFAARNDILREGLARIEAEKQLAAASAALATEREACDQWRAAARTGGYESLKAAEEYHDARRAAEAKGAEHG